LRAALPQTSGTHQQVADVALKRSPIFDENSEKKGKTDCFGLLRLEVVERISDSIIGQI
jgi:hypothetical protein